MLSGDLIIVGNLVQAASDLAAFEGVAAVWWKGQDHIVNDAGVIAKDAEGNDRQDVQTTERWDTLKRSPDGRYYWISPSKREQYALWKEYLAIAGYTLQCEEIEKPDGWDEWLSENTD